MKTLPLCQQCQTPLPASSPEGLCPKCLVKVGMDDSVENAADSREEESLPKLEEIASHFPHLEIVKLIGHGGMGFVYKARQPGLDRSVCLKILSPRLSRDRSFAERFIREAKAMARLNHPNIISVHDFGITGGFFYFVMEYIDGMDLWQLEHAKRLSPTEALSVVSQVCDALQYAHDEGVIHRDIKPSNILIDKRGRVKIADFGLAKLLRQQHQPTQPKITQSRMVMGTPHYMAPEQMEKPTEVDHRADIYSMGVVFYEMLTGELPIGRFAPPSQKATLDPRIDDVVLRALEKEPKQRYQKAGEVKNRVDTIIHKMVTPGETRVAMEGKQRSWKVGKEVLPWAFATVNLVCVLALWWRLETRFSEKPLAENVKSSLPSAGEEAGEAFATTFSGAKPASPSVDEEAINPPAINLFNGNDLSGWSGDDRYWSVKNGCIVARTPNDAPQNLNTCLIWQGGNVSDFELRYQFKPTVLRGNFGAGGVIYRGRQKTNDSDLSGYECQFDRFNIGRLANRDRPAMMSFTQKTTVKGDDKGNDQMRADGDLIPMGQVSKLFKKDDWNECVITAQGDHFTHAVNGTVVADLIDDNPKKRQDSGLLGLMLNTAMAARCKWSLKTFT